MTQREAYHELCAYTLAHGDPAFIHQHVVDAFAAQTADEHTKPITLTFALIGLYLHVERHFTGKRVQQAHQYLARERRSWPSFALPQERGSPTALEVLARPAGVARDEAIHEWCEAVWEAFRDVHRQVFELWSTYGSA
jgi:hypothetical protein